MHDVTTIGSGTRDVFLKSDKFTILKSAKSPTGVAECVPLGSKLDVEEILLTTGGGATNAAVTFARLGMRAACVCRIGDDSVGKDVLADLKAEGVDTSLIRPVKNEMTAYSTLLTAKNGERSVLVYRGAAAKFTGRDVPLDRCLSKWFYLTSLGGNLALSKKIVLRAKACGAQLAWNPGGGEILAGMKAFRPLLPYVAALTLNREEARALTGERTIPKMLDALATPGNVAIVTDGQRGAYARKDGRTIHAKTTGAKAVSRTGAGDAFFSGAVAALMKGKGLAYALAVGTLNAEGVIGSLGAKQGLLERWPARKDIERVRIAMK